MRTLGRDATRSTRPRSRTSAEPLRHAFPHRSYTWLVDLDELPPPRAAASARRASTPATTSAAPRRTLRREAGRFLATEGIDLRRRPGAHAAHARVLGYVFNPLTPLLVPHGDGTAGVRGRRGAQHLRRAARLPGAPRRAGPGRRRQGALRRPFNTVDGHYRMRLPEPGERLQHQIVLERPGQAALRRGRDAARPGRATAGAAPALTQPARAARRVRPHPPTASTCGCATARCDPARPTDQEAVQ